MTQLYTEYLIDFALKDRHSQAIRWEQAREARDAGPARGEGARTLLRLFHINRPQSAGSPLIPMATTEPRRAMPC